MLYLTYRSLQKAIKEYQNLGYIPPTVKLNQTKEALKEIYYPVFQEKVGADIAKRKVILEELYSIDTDALTETQKNLLEFVQTYKYVLTLISREFLETKCAYLGFNKEQTIAVCEEYFKMLQEIR